MVAQAHRLRAAGAARVLLKGGHLPGGDEAVDVLVGAGRGEAPGRAPASTPPTPTAPAAACPRPWPPCARSAGTWEETAQDAKTWLTGALAAADSLEIGQGHGPVHHFHELWSTP